MEWQFGNSRNENVRRNSTMLRRTEPRQSSGSASPASLCRRWWWFWSNIWRISTSLHIITSSFDTQEHIAFYQTQAENGNVMVISTEVACHWQKKKKKSQRNLQELTSSAVLRQTFELLEKARHCWVTCVLLRDNHVDSWPNHREYTRPLWCWGNRLVTCRHLCLGYRVKHDATSHGNRRLRSARPLCRRTIKP